ncbi:AMP-binding protein [Herbaspirillum lusitanum]|uniref:AMP-binding protein n=1 Tax=Herbaspirillum lusitanum TaxID=213312 RepID=A0ABW9A353_9BURK
MHKQTGELTRMPDLLQWPHAHFPASHIVGRRDGQPVDQAAFMQDLRAWQTTLQAQPGTRFALYLHDTLAFAAALFGAWFAGKTVYLPSDALPETCKSLQAEVDGFIGDFEAQWLPLSAARAGAQTESATTAFTALAPDFPGLVVYTSGSTGRAQAIPKKLSQMASEVATLEALFGARIGLGTGAAEIVATISHQHIYGLLFKVLWPLNSGRAIHAHSAFFPEDLLRIVPPRPWLLLSSPAHLKRFPDMPGLPGNQHLQAIFSSGGPLLADVSQATRKLFGHTPIEIYGSSETGGVAWRQAEAVTGSMHGQGRTARDERWHTMPAVEVRVAADSACLEVRSPHLPDRQWFAMADRAEAAEDGRFFLRGRADRLVKLEEKRISLDQIERLLLDSGLVSEARVLLHQGKSHRQFIAAFAVPTAAGRARLERDGKLALNLALRAALAGAIESIALPRLWRYLDAMPVNAQGKITVAALTALLDKPLVNPQASPPKEISGASSNRPTMPLHTVLQQSEVAVSLNLQIPPDLLYFEGHFPQAPILPGVVQVNWALALGRSFFTLPPRFLAIQALKFQRVVVPGAEVTLDLQHDAAKHALVFRLHSEAGQHASGRVLFGDH